MECCDEDHVCESENQTNFAFSSFKELKRVLNQAKELLGVKDDQQLHVLDYWSMPNSYMDSPQYCDRAVRAVGLDGLPTIQFERLHAANIEPPVIGLVLYEARHNPDLRYVALRSMTNAGHRYMVYIVPKGRVFHFRRHLNKMEMLSSMKQPPILEEGKLQQVVNNSIGFLLRKKDIEKYDVKIRRGILLSGSPGNGKTMVCRWLRKLCSDNGINWGTVTGGQIERAFHEGESLDMLFSLYTVTFYDDIDISYLNRQHGKGNIACAILGAMDGIRQDDHVIRIFTTNEEINGLDDAFIRPGRIDRCFSIDRPTRNLKKTLILERWHEEILNYIQENDLLDILLDRAGDFSFAELEAIRSLLVTNKLMGNGAWDLDVAFEEFYEGRKYLKERRTTGFNNNGRSYPQAPQVPQGIVPRHSGNVEKPGNRPCV